MSFTPRDVRACILGAIAKGWVYAGRNKELFRLNPPPDGPLFGPRQPPPSNLPAVRAAPREPNPWSVLEACLVCFKDSPHASLAMSHMVRRDFEGDLKDGWQPVSYGRDDGKLEHGLVCSNACLDKYLALIRRDLPTVYDHLLRNLKTPYETS